jgi:hypothetical protein
MTLGSSPTSVARQGTVSTATSISACQAVSPASGTPAASSGELGQLVHELASRRGDVLAVAAGLLGEADQAEHLVTGLEQGGAQPVLGHHVANLPAQHERGRQEESALAGFRSTGLTPAALA